MPLAVKSSKIVNNKRCDLCGEVKPELIEVDQWHGRITTVCVDWPKKGKRCFDIRFPFNIVECGSSEQESK